MHKRAKQILNDPVMRKRAEHLDARGWVRPTSQKRAADTRDRLIEAAEAVFAEKGYMGARINDIADHAGVSPASVYVRFKDKDGLFNAVLDRFAEQIAATLDHFFNGDGFDDVPTPTAIFATVLDNANKFVQNAGIVRATLQRGLSEPQTMARFLRMRQTLVDHLVLFVVRRCPEDAPEEIRARVTDGFDTAFGALVMRITLRDDRSDPLAFAGFLGDLIVPYILDPLHDTQPETGT